jgi:hypothetical protein
MTAGCDSDGVEGLGPVGSRRCIIIKCSCIMMLGHRKLQQPQLQVAGASLLVFIAVARVSDQTAHWQWQ